MGKLLNISDLEFEIDQTVLKIIYATYQEAIKQNFYYDISFSKNSSYKDIKLLDPSLKANLFLTLCHLIKTERPKKGSHKKVSIYDAMLSHVSRMKIKFSEKDLSGLMRFYKSEAEKYNDFGNWPIGSTINQIEKVVKEKGLSEYLENEIREMLSWPEFNDKKRYHAADLNKAKLKLQKIGFSGDEPGLESPEFLLDESDPFGIHVNSNIATLEMSLKSKFYQVFYLASTASSAKPTKKFLKSMKDLVDSFKSEVYKEHVHSWINFAAELENRILEDSQWEEEVYLDEKNSLLLKGLVWSLVQFHDAKSLELVAKLADRAYKKIPWKGPAATALGNACVYCLALSKGLVGVSYLSRLKLKVTQNNTKKLIQKYIDEVAEKRGISSAEIEDMAVPDYGLIKGCLESDFEDYKLILNVESVGKTSLTWLKPEGRAQKSVPAFVKNSSKLSEKLKKIKAINKQVQKSSTTQRDRIENSFIQNRTWTYENFTKYYHEHGLVSTVANKLIWNFSKSDQTVAAVFIDGQWQDLNGEILDWIEEGVEVTLWHPLEEDIDGVLAWRQRLEALQIQQPLKQAFREVYILTDAEVNTRSYSNRMAAHILKQHQFNALAGLRNWKYTLVGWYDGMGDDRATLNLPEWKLKAEFWIQEVHADDEVSDSGVWTYVSTDQVRFTDEAGETLDLVDVPKIVFSEVMRDVDLFVGVCSVGNDPNWADNGGLPQYNDYWQNFSFGDLSEVAKTRKTVLENLIPRLKIKNVARIEGKFLIVEGKLRTYKIHIGSTNILMEPNDQYLCIVPDRKKDSKADVFLPFEGDKSLSVVLSKAFMLAEDTKIKDPTITSQINR